MATYYFDSAEILAPFTVRSNEPMFDVDTVSLKKQRASQNVQRWELSFNILTTKETEVDSLVNTVQNMDVTSTMIMPQLPSVANLTTITSNPTLLVAADAGSTTIYANHNSADGLLPKGSFIKFNNSNKIYITTNDANFNQNFAVSIGVYPKLRVGLTTSNTILANSSAILTYYRSIDNVQGITFTDGILSNPGTIDLIEAV